MSKKQTETKPRPVVTLRDGSVKAAIWRNESENGPFHGVTFARTYKDGDGNYHDTDSYSGPSFSSSRVSQAKPTTARTS